MVPCLIRCCLRRLHILGFWELRSGCEGPYWNIERVRAMAAQVASAFIAKYKASCLNCSLQKQYRVRQSPREGVRIRTCSIRRCSDSLIGEITKWLMSFLRGFQLRHSSMHWQMFTMEWVLLFHHTYPVHTCWLFYVVHLLVNSYRTRRVCLV